MNRPLKILLFINGLFVLAGNIVGPLYALYIESIGGNIKIVSATWSVMLVSLMATNLLLIRFGDRIKEHEYLLATGYLIRGAAWVGFAFSSSIFHILLLQIVIGIGEALGSTSFDAIFAEHLDKKAHIKDYAIWKSHSTLVAAIATLIGGFAVANIGFSPVFIFMSAVAFICFIFILILPRKTL